MADRQGSAAGRLRVIKGPSRRIHVDEFQADLNIGAVLFQLNASSGFKRYFVAGAYFFARAFHGGFIIRCRIITTCNGKRPAFLQFGDIRFCSIYTTCQRRDAVRIGFNIGFVGRYSLRKFRIQTYGNGRINRVTIDSNGGFIICAEELDVRRGCLAQSQILFSRSVCTANRELRGNVVDCYTAAIDVLNDAASDMVR